MAISDHELTVAWREVLTLSNVKPGEQISILVSDDSDRQSLAASRRAAMDLGAVVTVLHLPPVNGGLSLSRDKTAYMGRTPLTGNDAAMAALKRSDMVIDLMLLLFSPEQGEILEAGTRILLAVEPPEILVRMVPTIGDRARVLAATKALTAAKTMTVTSGAGTDFRCELGEFPPLSEYGFVDEPGRWDHWPSGFIATWPNELSAEGVIVIDTGDIILPFKRYVQSPITLEIAGGYVRNISGGFDAEYLSDYMKSFHDPEVYAMSHIGWGLQPRAQWTALGLYDREQTLAMDARAFYGNFLFSTGANIEAGGKRDTACHMDIPLRRCSLSLDGEPMTIDGDVIPPDQKVSR
jgi:2,5-dihydroxypyridine 5,6-dioxygenase